MILGLSNLIEEGTMKFTLQLLAFCVLTTSIFSCSQPKSNFVARDVRTARISLTRTNCYGKCPVYKVTVYGTGNVEFEGFANTKVLGKQSTQIPVDSVRTLVAEIEKNQYYALKDNYEEYQMTDLPTVFTEVEIDGVLKKIKHYQGDRTTPQQLSDLEIRIDEIATTPQWLE